MNQENYVKTIEVLHNEVKATQANEPQAVKKRPLKILLLGDQQVGKTSLLTKLQDGDIKEVYRATIGADFIAKEVTINDQPVMLQIWDTAGQERFQSLGNAFYRGTDCCVLVYDITSRKSFVNLNKWKEQFIENASPADIVNYPFVIVGNKVDKEDSRQVHQLEAQTISKSFFEASAKNGSNVGQIFTEIARMLVERGLNA